MRDTQFYPVDRLAMDHFLELCTRRHFDARATIMKPGDPGTTLMYLLEGSVTVMTEGDDGRELILSYLNPGDFLGEMGLFTRTGPREALVRAKTRCEVAEIPYDRLRGALEAELKDHALAIMTAIGAKLAQRLMQTRRKVEHLAFLDTQGRVARALIDLCSEPDALSHPEGTQIRITRQEVSRIVGCSREMAGRVMKALEEEGMIRASGKTIVVLGTFKGAPLA
ncbi:MAG: cAMP-activated global transcriptional regulator CRP [Wenzhouxiangellaceae bacterium]|nr:cAMP-activated global transcriptional regulator CRP [Wenzhouxiangellaceae bacterium]